MFIKVHRDINQPIYINTDKIDFIVPMENGNTRLFEKDAYNEVIESAEDIMRVIGYFRVATIDEK